MATIFRTMLLLAVIAMGQSLPRPTNQSDKESDSSWLIVGGKEAEVGSVPFQISLQVGGGHYCGGSILNPTTILTAAHCLTRFPLNSYTVLAGVHNVEKPEATVQSVALSKMILHEGYEAGNEGSPNDIAILQLAQPLQLSEALRTAAIELPTAGFSATGTATVTGWGSLSYGGSYPATLQTVEVPIISDADCRQAYGNDIADSMICAGYTQGGQDSCSGDSGGPLVISKDGRPLLVGVVSWGQGCAEPGYPGVYTEVSAFNDWIQKNSQV